MTKAEALKQARAFMVMLNKSKIAVTVDNVVASASRAGHKGQDLDRIREAAQGLIVWK